MSNEMPKKEFEKSLARLETFAKSQLHHTPASSRTTSWAGSTEQDENEHEDGIDDNGTDYNGVKKSLANKMAKGGNLTAAEVAIYNGKDPRPYLGAKVSKGQKLTAAEQWAVKGGMPFGKDEEDEDMFAKKSSPMPSKANAPGENKDANSVPNTNANDKEEEIEHDAKKSLAGAVSKSQTLQSGIEMSPFLYEQTRALGEALKGTEARVVKSVMAVIAPLVERVGNLEKGLVGFVGDQSDFNKSLADGVIAIGHQVSGTAELADVAASQAARAPRSQLRSVAGGQGVQAVSKSFGGGTGSEDINKSQVIEAMGEMVKSQELNHLDLIKYETTGQMSPKTQQAVMASLQGGR